VAQGLAAGSQRLVLPMDTLMAVAEEARFQGLAADPDSAGARHISALLDARMDEVYLQHFEWTGAGLQAIGPCELCAPEAVRFPPAAHRLVAGNALEVYRERLGELPAGSRWIAALPTAAALLRLAPRLLQQAVPPAQALPLYVRDKVAQTTEERSAAKVAKAEAAELAAHRRPAP
jgi:tRNA threonylcarbamoyladenosine biosynthesis protein TsaB